MSLQRLALNSVLLSAALAAAATAQTIMEFPIPTANTNPVGIVSGPDGNLWFTESSLTLNSVGRISPTGSITSFGLTGALTQPGGITAGPDGNLWFTVESSGAGKVPMRPSANASAPPPMSTASTDSAGL